MKHKCGKRIRMHKCFECEHFDADSMKCYPNSNDCGKEYDLTIDDIITEDVCDFFSEGKPYVKIKSSCDTKVFDCYELWTRCPYCKGALNMNYRLPTLTYGGVYYYECPYCERLFKLGE